MKNKLGTLVALLITLSALAGCGSTADAKESSSKATGKTYEDNIANSTPVNGDKTIDEDAIAAATDDVDVSFSTEYEASHIDATY